MKKLILSISTLLFATVTFGTPSPIKSKEIISETVKVPAQEYYEGFKEGWKEGWKDVKGPHSYPPYAPYPSYPAYPKSEDSWRDGYNDGFKAGMRKAQSSR